MTLSMSSTRAKHRWVLLAAIVAICTLGVSALALATPGDDPTPIPAGYAGFTVQDSGLANDVPGQVDLTQMGRDDATATTYKLFWSWDSISSWTGTGQTGDACALFDTDTPGNTFIDFVVCVRVENFEANPEDVRILSPDGVFAFTCTDKKNDRCTNPTPFPFGASDIQAGALGTLSATGNLITHSDPFPAGESSNHDSTVEVHILKSLISGNEELVNVCSYPSAGNGGNNNPFDCIVSPGGGFLRVVKVADTGAPNFTFSATRGAATLGAFTASGFASSNTETATLTGGATLLPILVDPPAGPNVTLTETTIPSPWALTAAACVVEDKVPPGTGSTLANNQITTISIQSGKVTTCTFTDQLQTGTLIVKKLVINDNGGTLQATGFSFQVNSGTATAFVTDPDVSPSDPLKGKNTLTMTAGTAFAVTEPTVTGYSTTLSGCTGTIAAGQTSTCTITNNDQAGTLIVKKLVINDNGGTRLAAGFSFQVNSGTATAFVTDPDVSPSDPLKGKNTLTVNAGTYDITEPTVTGYNTTYSNCDDVVVTNGGTATCTITNNDTKATPTGATVQSWVLKDSITITGIRHGATNPAEATASVTFRLYGNANCTGDPIGSRTDTTIVAGDAATPTGIEVTASGTYYWTAEYSGDQYNNGFTTACGAEITQILALDAGRDDFAPN